MLASLIHVLLDRLFGALVTTPSSQMVLEIAALRQQVGVLKRANPHPRLTWRDRAFLSACARHLPKPSLKAFIVTPKSLLQWHKKLVAWKWARYTRRPRRGRPGLAQDTVTLIATDNPTWGYRRVHGEIVNLGVKVSATAVARIMRRHHLGPAPRGSDDSWYRFIKAQAKTILACDFFCVETAFLRRYYVLFFIEVATRRVIYAGATTNPDGPWVTQQARHLFMTEAAPDHLRFLIHDRDSKFTAMFDEVFRTEGFKIVKTPYRAPRANAFAERFVKSCRTECLDHLLIVSWRHLDRVMRQYVFHYNRHRPHRALGLRAPEATEAPAPVSEPAPILRRDVVGGLIHEYYRKAA